MNSTVADIRSILNHQKDDIAFIIGNGINRFDNKSKALSWDDLLVKLWELVSFQTLSKIPKGISITEFYDVLELENTRRLDLTRNISGLMKDWDPGEHHRLIVSKIKEYNAPLLTTNFEEVLAKASGEYKMFKMERNGFTDFYPWGCYHTDKMLNSPTEGFGIWYINGMVNYHRSIKLGLTQYMGAVERARNLIKGTKGRLYSKNSLNWAGCNTWLHLIFNKSLLIFGLGLDENETFLRWLLIERCKYFRKYPEYKHKGWYICKKAINEQEIQTGRGKKFFLEKIGFEVIEVDSYDDIYYKIWE